MGSWPPNYGSMTSCCFKPLSSCPLDTEEMNTGQSLWGWTPGIGGFKAVPHFSGCQHKARTKTHHWREMGGLFQDLGVTEEGHPSCDPSLSCHCSFCCSHRPPAFLLPPAQMPARGAHPPGLPGTRQFPAAWTVTANTGKILGRWGQAGHPRTLLCSNPHILSAML